MMHEFVGTAAYTAITIPAAAAGEVRKRPKAAIQMYTGIARYRLSGNSTAHPASLLAIQKLSLLSYMN